MECSERYIEADEHGAEPGPVFGVTEARGLKDLGAPLNLALTPERWVVVRMQGTPQETEYYVL